MEKFYLDFKSDATGLLEINEPINYSNITFDCEQKDKKYGRDIFYNAGEFELEFVDYREHYLDKLLYYCQYFGYESQIDFIIEIDNIQTKLGELDFAQASTDQLTYFKCKIIQDGALQIIKRRSDIKVDLFSDKDIDGNSITPLVPENILILSKPAYQKSNYIQNNAINIFMVTTDSRNYFVNPCANILKSEIKNTLTYFELVANNYQNFETIRAIDNIKNIKIKITDFDLSMYAHGRDGGNGYVNFALNIYYGKPESPSITALKTVHLDDGQTHTSTNENFEFIIPNLNRGESIWIAPYFYLRQSSSLPGADMICETSIGIPNIDITAESTTYNTFSPSFRLVDVMRQVVKSISGLDINAPRFDFGGEFYENRLINGNLLRNIIDKPFTVSLSDIEKSIVEMHSDYEVNDTVFFGCYEDFYKPVEIWYFDNVQFSDTYRNFNPRYLLNQFKFKYKKYQSLKEQEQDNSADTIHGESIWVTKNKKVENELNVEVDWIRDAFLLEEARRKGFTITKDTASQNDDDIFCIDSIETLSNLSFTETSVLNHVYEPTTNRLSLYNDNSINFTLLGITVGANFVINAPDNNTGIYTVFSVLPNQLELNKIDAGVIGVNNNGIRSTSYTYYISPSYIPFTNYTNQGFTNITNLSGGDTYSNLRYSVKRNINRSYLQYLSTANNYNLLNPIDCTYYKNNGKCTTTYEGNTVVENSSIAPNNALLSPFTYENMIFCNVSMADFIYIQSKLRSERGYISTIDNNDYLMKIYIQKMSYNPLEMKLTITGEEKANPSLLAIENNNDTIIFNNEIFVNTFKYTIIDDSVNFFDNENRRLYNSIFWNKVTVNGAIASNINELIGWLELLN